MALRFKNLRRVLFDMIVSSAGIVPRREEGKYDRGAERRGDSGPAEDHEPEDRPSRDGQGHHERETEGDRGESERWKGIGYSRR